MYFLVCKIVSFIVMISIVLSYRGIMMYIGVKCKIYFFLWIVVKEG